MQLADGWPAGPHLSAIPYLSAQVSVGEAATTDLLVYTNTFNVLNGKSIPARYRKYSGVTAYVYRLTVLLNGRVVGRVGTHTGGLPLINMGERFKQLSYEKISPLG